MGNWPIRWRVLTEATLLVVFVAVCSSVWGIPGAIGAGVLGFLVAWYRAERLGLLIHQMTEGVLRTASINNDHRIDPAGPAELARMARAVNRLADRLVAQAVEEAGERQRLGSILESMAEGVVVLDESGSVEFVNPAARGILDSPPSFRLGELVTKLNRNYEINEVALQCARTGEPRQAQVELRDRHKLVQAMAVPLSRTPEHGRRSLLLLTDLTEIRRVETTRREFVSNASHELRTPISAIKAAVETLQRGALTDPEAGPDFLRRIDEDVNRLEQMVTEMLQLSRLESGQTPLHLQQFDAANLVTDIVDRLGPVAGESSISLVADIQPRIPELHADRDRVEQVLTNLVMNAIRATPRDGEVTMKVEPCEEGIRFSVRDTGEGVESEHLPHIFERFYKVEQDRNQTGAGLGLAIAKHIAQAHGGTIWVESRLGEGSTFFVQLPLTARDS